jgi:hypothetical protein
MKYTMKYLLVICIFFFAYLPVAEKSYSQDWPTFLGNEFHTGVCEGIKLPRTPQMIWQKRLSNGTLNPVTVAGNRVYVTNYFPGTHDCSCAFSYCLDGNTGAEIWYHQYNELAELSQ